MKFFLSVNSVSFLLLLIFFNLPVKVEAFADNSTDQPLKILFVSSYSKDFPAHLAIEKGLKQTLTENGIGYELLVESMYSPYRDSDEFQNAFYIYLKEKYHKVTPDYLIAWSDSANYFCNRYPDLFPGSRRIYLQKPSDLEIQFQNQYTVIDFKNDFKKSVEETIAFAKADSILVVGSTENSTARKRLSDFQTIIKDIQHDVAFEYLIDQPLDSLRARLAAEPIKKTAVFFLLMFSDGRGQQMTAAEVVRLLAENSRVPIYSYYESLLGHGIVGGYLISQTRYGELVGELIVSWKHREQAISLSAMRYAYDWGALEKWKIDTSRIPEDAIIINRSPKLLAEYYPQIIAGIVVIAFQMVLIIFLVIHRNERRKAERELKTHRDHLEEMVAERTAELQKSHLELTESQKRFRSLSDAALEGIVFITKNDMRILDLNKYMAQMVGFSVKELIGKEVLEIIEPSQHNLVCEKIRDNDTALYETILIDKNGTNVPVSIQGRAFTYKGQQIRIAAVRDLRELKKAEEEIYALKGILPICSTCKKIRDDKGYWNQIELYIRDHSEAEFSHGICPECAKKLYPDIDLYNEET